MPVDNTKDLKIYVGTLNAELWPSIGPILTRKSTYQEIGDYPFVEDDMVWIIAQRENNVLGFCSIKNGSPLELTNDYILPEYRKLGIYKILFEKRLSLVEEEHLRIVTRNQIVVDMSLKHDFKIKSQRGTWTYLERGKDVK